MRRVVISAILALAGLSAPVWASPLSGRQFEAVSLDGATIVGGHAPTLSIAGSKATGMGGCNRFGGSVRDSGRYVMERRGNRIAHRIAKGELRIGAISATRKYCGPGSVREAAFFSLLGQTRAYRLGRSELRLYSGGRMPRLLMVLRAAD